MVSQKEESKFQTKLIQKLYSQGAWTFNVHGSRMQKSGVPDVLILHPRFYGFVELKAEKNKPSPKQVNVGKAIIKRLFPSYVMRSTRIPGVNAGGVWEREHEISIENFDGQVLCRPSSLDMVLNCLQSLTNGKNLFEKIPTRIMENVRRAKDGDMLYIAGKQFLCKGRIE